MSEPTLFQGMKTPGAGEPLAARLRPTRLEDFLGQEHLLGPGKPLGDLIRRGEIGSCIFWGPPGSGKTTLARIIANYTDRRFVPFSAVTEGVARVREIIQEADERLKYEGRGTILFCDEIHHFNKAQQDAFLPWVENGTITLIGATTENPSFELTGALLSRCRVFVLEPLKPEHIRLIVRRALEQAGSGTADVRGGAREPGGMLSEDAIEALVEYAQGDARRALNALEAVLQHLPASPISFPVSRQVVVGLLEKPLPVYDKSGESHFNLISALHKAVRGSDVEGALYWLARMLAGGEDPLYIARRLVRIASEDVGLADPRALTVALAARDAYHFLGAPEGELALAQATIYLATAPKSNRVYEAFGRAREAAREHPAEPVPLHIRNAPTALMKELGYGAGYRYAHDSAQGYVPQEYLPENLRGVTWYEPTEFGYEKTVRERIEWWRQIKDRLTREAGGERRDG
ncbi:MAG TPA: replication-associated recombination protein A [Gemmatimonadales bacterium]|nr:replication-associated recombination protein A [Gemmatimonadales bacterium]